MKCVEGKEPEKKRELEPLECGARNRVRIVRGTDRGAEDTSEVSNCPFLGGRVTARDWYRFPQVGP